jgi:raffinose/stachyose/melibiose transport system permease protein
MGLFRYTWRSFSRELLLLFIALLWCLPLYVAVVLAVKSNSAVYLHPLAVPTHPKLGNFSTAWNSQGVASVSRAFVNNLVITTSSVLLTILIGGSCAYTLARRHSKWSTGLFLLFVVALIMPFQLGIVPLYIFLRHLHLIGTYAGIILLHTALFTPLTVFLYTGFIRTLPKEYEEAAQVDGAGFFRMMRKVVIPLLWPITGTVAILLAVFVWNEFFLSVIFLSGTPNQPLSVAIYSFVGEFASQWNYIFAVVLISIAPILLFYVFAQKQLIKGFTGGIRG